MVTHPDKTYCKPQMLKEIPGKGALVCRRYPDLRGFSLSSDPVIQNKIAVEQFQHSPIVCYQDMRREVY